VWKLAGNGVIPATRGADSKIATRMVTTYLNIRII
jgi:hypothetical protein